MKLLIGKQSLVLLLSKCFHFHFKKMRNRFENRSIRIHFIRVKVFKNKSLFHFYFLLQDFVFAAHELAVPGAISCARR